MRRRMVMVDTESRSQKAIGAERIPRTFYNAKSFVAGTLLLAWQLPRGGNEIKRQQKVGTRFDFSFGYFWGFPSYSDLYPRRHGGEMDRCLIPLSIFLIFIFPVQINFPRFYD